MLLEKSHLITFRRLKSSENGLKHPMCGTQYLPVETQLCASPGNSAKSTTESTFIIDVTSVLLRTELVSRVYLQS